MAEPGPAPRRQSIMPKRLRIRNAFVTGFYRGLAAPSEIYRAPVIRMPYESDGDAMRSDWNRVGDSLRAAVTRAHGEAPRKTR